MVRTIPEKCVLCHRRSGTERCKFGVHVGARFGLDLASHLFKRGQSVFLAGTPAHSVYVLRTGCVKVYRSTSRGEDQVLRLLGPGEIVGYRPVLAGEPYAASAEAVEDSALCIIPAATVREAVRDEPDLALDLLAKMAIELRLSEELMMDLIHRPVRQRAARLLLSLIADNRHATEIVLIHSRYLRRQDMARMIGTTPETFSRVLRTFAQRGLITLTRDHVELRDEVRLRKVAGTD